MNTFVYMKMKQTCVTIGMIADRNNEIAHDSLGALVALRKLTQKCYKTVI